VRVAEMIIEPARIFLAPLVCLTGVVCLANAVLREEMPYTRGLARGLLRADLWIRWTLPVLIYFALVSAWALHLYPVWTGGVAVAMLYLVRRFEQRGWSDINVKTLGTYSPSAACMMALLLGDLLYQQMDIGDAQLGWDISAGILAASWLLCGVNKLRQSGLAWMGSHNIALLLAERSYLGPPIGRSLRKFALRRPGFLVMVGVVGLVLELLAVFFCIPDLRWGFAIAVALFMLVNYILLGFIEPEWGLVMIAVAAGSGS
jgi:hypothetical protein